MADPIIKNERWYSLYEKLRNIGYKFVLHSTKSMYIHLVVNRLISDNRIMNVGKLALEANNVSELELAVLAECRSDKFKRHINYYVNDYSCFTSMTATDVLEMTSHITTDYVKQLVLAGRLFLAVNKPDELFGYLQDIYQQWQYKVKTTAESEGLIKRDEELYTTMSEYLTVTDFCWDE